MQGFLLGLTNGTTCLAFCAPVLVPFLLGEGKNVRQNVGTLLQFLAGRLGGYLIFGLLAWAVGQFMNQFTRYQSLVFGAAYVVLAGMMLSYGLRKAQPHCGSVMEMEGLRAWLQQWPILLPVGMGLLAGLKPCPPLLLAFTGAANAGTLLESLLFFCTFFLGTSIYLVPVVFLGALNHVPALRTIGKLAATIMALYYLYSGIILFAGGIHQL